MPHCADGHSTEQCACFPHNTSVHTISDLRQTIDSCHMKHIAALSRKLSMYVSSWHVLVACTYAITNYIRMIATSARLRLLLACINMVQVSGGVRLLHNE